MFQDEVKTTMMKDRKFHVEHCNARVDNIHVHFANVVPFDEEVSLRRSRFSNSVQCEYDDS